MCNRGTYRECVEGKDHRHNRDMIPQAWKRQGCLGMVEEWAPNTIEAFTLGATEVGSSRSIGARASGPTRGLYVLILQDSMSWTTHNLTR